MQIKIMAVWRTISVPLLFILALPTFLYAQDGASTLEHEVQDLRHELVQRLSPTEAAFLERLDAIEDKLKKQNQWFQPAIVLGLIVAAAGWIIALFQFYGTRKQRTWELLLESLRWFEGGTQPRSIGIALVESKWQYHKEFRGRWASILVNQAIYLLTRKKNRDAIHERANLYRIMDLLINTVDPSGHIAEIERQLLGETLKRYDPDSGSGLRGLDDTRLETWRQHFC